MVDRYAAAAIATVVIAQLILIIFKIASIIKWSWFWIFMPLWLIYTIFLLVISCFILSMITFNIKKRMRKDER